MQRMAYPELWRRARSGHHRPRGQLMAEGVCWFKAMMEMDVLGRGQAPDLADLRSKDKQIILMSP